MGCPNGGVHPSQVVGAHDPEASIEAVAQTAGNRDLMAADVRSATLDSLRAIMLIRAYRIRGHLLADLDYAGLRRKCIRGWTRRAMVSDLEGF